VHPDHLSAIVNKVIQEAGSEGTEIPWGYTDQIGLRNIELWNADKDAGPVKVLRGCGLGNPETFYLNTLAHL
jgi:hypothetical protein